MKILKDIVLLLPGFPKATEACKKIMERINDDEPNVKVIFLQPTSFYIENTRGYNEVVCI